jgi:hypothetical protein
MVRSRSVSMLASMVVALLIVVGVTALGSDGGGAGASPSPAPTGKPAMVLRSLVSGPFAWLASTVPPTSWTRVTLPSGLGSLSVPPRLRAIHGDPGTATFAYFGSGGTYLAYLNVTPLQGDEGLTGWPGFRLDHLRDDDAISAREDGAVQSVRTGQSLRSCVTDDYVTKIGHHHFHEVACFVMTTSTGSVVVAATPSGDPAHVWTQLERAVAAYPFA